jgi:hypothetical protein
MAEDPVDKSIRDAEKKAAGSARLSEVTGGQEKVGRPKQVNHIDTSDDGNNEVATAA